MPKAKYYYDSETHSYRPIEKRKRRTFWRVLTFLTAAAIFAFLFVFVASTFIDSPQERRLKRELQNMEEQYAILEQRMQKAENVLADVEQRDNSIYRIYFDASPIPEEQRRAGYGGVNRYQEYAGYANSELITESYKRIDQLTKRIVVQSKSLDEIARLATEKEELLRTIPAIQPVKNEDLTRMASGYGWRTDPFLKTRKFHKGMDFTARRGTPVYATGDGVVKRADGRATGYGNHIRIDHGFGYTTLYGHLRRGKPFNVRRGQKVKRGDLIGWVGSTGRSEAPHLHYEVRKDGRQINPINFYYGDLSPEEFDLLLQQSKTQNQSLD